RKNAAHGVSRGSSEADEQAPQGRKNDIEVAPQAELLPETIETWLLAPVEAPDFSLPDSAGQPHTLAALRGKPALLNFWVSSSAKCQKDLELFNRLYPHWRDQGLQLLTVNVDDSQGPARESHLSFPVLRGSDDISGI